LEREHVLNGGVPPDEIDEGQEEVEEQVESIAGTFSLLFGSVYWNIFLNCSVCFFTC